MPFSATSLSSEDVDEHNLFKELSCAVYSEIQRPSYKMGSGETCSCSVVMTFVNVADEKILTNTHIDPGKVCQKIPLFTTLVETLAADKHVIAKLPLVLFAYLFDGVCILFHNHGGNTLEDVLIQNVENVKVSQFKSKVTRGFSFLLLHNSCSPLCKKKKNQGKPLGPGQ